METDVILMRVDVATLLPNRKANDEDESKCVESRKPFEDHCPPMWVTHFDRGGGRTPDLSHI